MMSQHSLYPSSRETQSNPYYVRRLRRILAFQGLALFLAFVGLLSMADWRVTVACYAIAICYLPFFAKRSR